MKKFMCPSCGHVWEEKDSRVKSIDRNLVEHIQKLMLKTIGDTERRIPFEQQGWQEFDPQTSNSLLLTSLCERDATGRIRLIPNAEIPPDIAALSTAKTYVDLQRAWKLTNELERIWRSEQRNEAVLKGLARMLENGIRTVSPMSLTVAIEKDKLVSADWFTLAHQAVNPLVMSAAKQIWKDDASRIEAAQKLLGDATALADNADKVLKWKQVVHKLGTDALEALGFLWFADTILEKIDSSEVKIIVQRELVNLIGIDMPRKIESALEEEDVDYVYFPWW